MWKRQDVIGPFLARGFVRHFLQKPNEQNVSRHVFFYFLQSSSETTFLAAHTFVRVTFSFYKVSTPPKPNYISKTQLRHMVFTMFSVA